jgi:hypothetical protein
VLQHLGVQGIAAVRRLPIEHTKRHTIALTMMAATSLRETCLWSAVLAAGSRLNLLNGEPGAWFQTQSQIAFPGRHRAPQSGTSALPDAIDVGKLWCWRLALVPIPHLQCRALPNSRNRNNNEMVAPPLKKPGTVCIIKK